MKKTVHCGKPVSDLSYCRASYNTLYGKIISDWHIDERGNFKLNVEIPVNTSATIVLPQWGKECAKEPIQVLSGSYSFKVLK